jgi:hypothetical protein
MPTFSEGWAGKFHGCKGLRGKTGFANRIALFAELSVCEKGITANE